MINDSTQINKQTANPGSGSTSTLVISSLPRMRIGGRRIVFIMGFETRISPTIISNKH